MNFPPSENVHISPAQTESGTARSTGPDHGTVFGFTLKGLLVASNSIDGHSRPDRAGREGPGSPLPG
jgi:hypothetical protein